MTFRGYVVLSGTMSIYGSSDYQDYLVYKRPPGFQFNYPADKKFVWVKQDPKIKKFVIAEVLDDSDDSVVVVRVVDTAEVFNNLCVSK